MRQSLNIRIGGPLTPAVKQLMLLNAGVFLVQQLVSLFAPGVIESIFGLNHQGLVHEFKLWQPVTYMFLHGGWLHILFNLLGLWMFAGELEALWGSKAFLRYYLYTGTGAGLFIAMMNYLVAARYGMNTLMPYAPTTIGASGAIYGILLAYGITWPNREVLLYFLFPIKMKYLVAIFGLLEFFGTLSSVGAAGGNISHIGHLGGLIAGFAYIVILRRYPLRERSGPATRRTGFIGEYFRKRRLKKKQQDIEERILAKKIIDTLLEKIARNGMGSLTADERNKLEWARRHYFPENNETIH